jgi:hypothetical protein
VACHPPSRGIEGGGLGCPKPNLILHLDEAR